MRNLIQNFRSALNRLRESAFKGLFRARFRYDVFISYSHSDAKNYAVNLKKQLGSLDFACFIDEEESPPGLSLGPTLEKALKKSAVLVLLATERALTRPYIALEFERFAPSGRRIIPINISGALTNNNEQALSKSPWNLISERKLIWIDEADDAFAKQNPSPPIADGIDKLFKYTRRNVRVRTEIIGTAALVLLAAFGAGFVIKGKNAELSEQVRSLAVAKIETQQQQGIAAEASKEAKRQLGLAALATTEAERQGQLAATAKKEAEHQQEIALTATAEADKQQELAKAATLEAERQLERSRQLRYVSDINLAQRAYEAGDMGKTSNVLNIHLPVNASERGPDLRSYYWYYLTHISYPALPNLKGHSARVNSAAFSPSGKLLASVSNDMTVKLWDTKTWQELATLKGHSAIVNSVSFSPDGQTLASADADGNVKLWNTSTLRQLAAIQADPGEVHLAFSPDGKILAFDFDRSVKLIDTSTWQETKAFEVGYVDSIAFSPDGKTLAVGDSSSVTLRDAGTGAELTTITRYLESVTSLAFSPDGKLLASASKTSLRLWDRTSRQELPPLKGHSNLVYAVAFSPDSKTLASVSYDKTVKLWDTSTWKELATLQGHSAGASSVAFSPDGKTLASTGDEADIKLWDTSTLHDLTTLTDPAGEVQGISSVAFSPDGKTVALATWGNTVKLWDSCARQALASLEAHSKPIYAVAFRQMGGCSRQPLTTGT
jgi:WD40 repeat protein